MFWSLKLDLRKETFQFLGDSLDNRFEMQFAGDLRIASISTLQFYQSLQLGRGQWKKQVVVDDQDSEIKFDVALDKNPCQMCREIISTNLQNIMAGNAVDKTKSQKKHWFHL